MFCCRLPGKAFESQQPVWLTHADEADSKIFSRAILAKVHTQNLNHFYLLAFLFDIAGDDARSCLQAHLFNPIINQSR